MLKKIPDRDITIVGTDMDDEAVGRFLVDEFYQVPHGQSAEYIPAMLSIVEKEDPDILFPESTFEVQPLAENKHKFQQRDVRVVVSDPGVIQTANNKFEMYDAISKQTDVELPEYYLVRTYEEFHTAAEELGYPDNPIVFKPPVGKGSRGVRIIDPEVDRRELLLEKKPNSLYIDEDEFEQIFADDDFPELLVMEYIDGEEETADSLCFQGDELLTSFKTVEEARWGVIVRGELVERPELLTQTQKILDAIPLSYCVNLQFIDGKLIEINPRVSTFIYQRDFLQAHLAMQLALGEVSKDEVRSYRDEIDVGRRMVRYMDQAFHEDGNRLL